MSQKRWLFVVCLGLVIGVLVAAWWFVWVPNWRPALLEGERFGIDVSAHQGLIDWSRVADDRIDFAYVKATEGGDFVDDRFVENWSEAGNAGLDRGAYHFFTLCTSGSTQAENFLSVASPDRLALPPAVDLELAGNCSRRPPTRNVQAEISDFLGIVEEAWDEDVLLYVGDDFESRYPTRPEFDRARWERRFLLRPNEEDWIIWQLHGYAKVEGIRGAVDLNVMRQTP